MAGKQGRNPLPPKSLVQNVPTLLSQMPTEKRKSERLPWKIVVLDFCASWCGPCRKEMRSMLTIYNELKADDLEFISVSLDDSEAKWRKMLDEEKLPWVMLWDKTGFPQKQQDSKCYQTAYGFYSIPFLVVIDKEGQTCCTQRSGVNKYAKPF